MNREVYKHIFSVYGRRSGTWVSAVSELIRSLIVRVIAVILLADVVAALATGDFDTAKRNVLLYGVLTILGTIISAIGELAGHESENRQYLIHTIEYYEKLTNKDLRFYRDNHAGYLATLFRQYADVSLLIIRYFRTEVLRTFISLTIPIIVLYTRSWKIGLVATLIVISQILYMKWASSKSQKYRIATHEIYRKITGEVADVITNIVAYKSSGRERQSKDSFEKLAQQEVRAFWLRRKTNVILDLPRNIITYGLSTYAIWLVIDITSSTTDTVALMVVTLIYIFQLLRNVADVPDIVDKLEDYVTKLHPALEILSHKNEDIKDSINAKKLLVSKGSIKFSNMSFAYTSGQAIFTDFNLEIKGGEKIGVVGLSGAGKSTLAGLLMRFDDVTNGSISIDGQEIKQIKQNSLRGAIAYVPQEPLLFHRTIKENIDYLNKSASTKDIIRAAKASHAHEFIEQLPHGYETVVGERGVKLSGGQKQRIVIARAVLKNAPIILFDEATSALDSESENIIQQSLPDIIGKHTAIIIAHRLSTVANLDRIIVMHNGLIEETGSHIELLAKKGRYYGLWERQTKTDATA